MKDETSQTTTRAPDLDRVRTLKIYQYYLLHHDADYLMIQIHFNLFTYTFFLLLNLTFASKIS